MRKAGSKAGRVNTTVHRWALKELPVLCVICRRSKRPVGLSCRLDEFHILVSGQWKCRYRAVDSCGDTVDFLLTATRDKAAARWFLERAIGLHVGPQKITIDKSGANTVAVHSVNEDTGLEIELLQSKYLNNMVVQDQRAIKHIVRPMLGFKSFWSARFIIAGFETEHIVRKGQLRYPDGQAVSAAHQFYGLAF